MCLDFRIAFASIPDKRQNAMSSYREEVGIRVCASLVVGCFGTDTDWTNISSRYCYFVRGQRVEFSTYKPKIYHFVLMQLWSGMKLLKSSQPISNRTSPNRFSQSNT